MEKKPKTKYLRYLEFERNYEEIEIDRIKEKLLAHLFSILDGWFRLFLQFFENFDSFLEILQNYPPSMEKAKEDYAIYEGTAGVFFVYIKLKQLRKFFFYIFMSHLHSASLISFYELYFLVIRYHSGSTDKIFG